MGAQLATRDDDDNQLGLSDRQVAALQKLAELGAEPAYEGPDGKMVYSEDPRTRAYQLVFQDKFGGPNRGQGRPTKERRAAEVLAEHIRENFTSQMSRAIARALHKKAGPRANLDAVRLAIEIERGERKLQIEEEEHEGNLGDTREELVATLFNLVGDPATAAAIEGSAEEISEAEVVNEGDEFAPTDREGRRSSATAPEDGRDPGSAGGNGRRRSTRDRSQSPNPFTQAALRRSAERR